MKFRTTQFLVLIIAANLCLGGAYYFFYNYIKTGIENTSILLGKISLGEQRNSRFNNLQKMVSETEDERQQLSTFLLPSGSAVEFLESLENLAKSGGLIERTNGFSEAPGQAGISKFLQIQITTVGSWSDTIYFLGQLENLPYSINIKTVNLSEQPGAGPKAANSWTASFDISVAETI